MSCRYHVHRLVPELFDGMYPWNLRGNAWKPCLCVLKMEDAEGIQWQEPVTDRAPPTDSLHKLSNYRT